jgi:hypothetical protein
MSRCLTNCASVYNILIVYLNFEIIKFPYKIPDVYMAICLYGCFSYNFVELIFQLLYHDNMIGKFVFATTQTKHTPSYACPCEILVMR